MRRPIAARILFVLGAAVWPGGAPSPTLRRRTEWAIARFREGGHDRLALSGGLGRHPPAEADVMAALARAAGIAEDRLILDRGAKTTIESAAFAATLPDARATAFTLVTDLYHGPRSRLAFAAYGLEAELDCPPPGGTARRSLIRSWLREVPALLYYLGHFVRLRLR